MTRLEVSGLSVKYGTVVAVDAVDLEVRAGEIVGLLGPNGAGKTTLIDAVTGFADSSGSVRFDGAELNQLPPHQRSRRGLGRTFQSGELFEDLTIRENVLTGAHEIRWWTVLRDLILPDRSGGGIDATLDALALDDVADRMPSEVSTGTRQLVAVARALAAAPSVLLLDEPAAGLDSQESRELGSSLKSVAASGVGILLVDHDVDLVLSISDRVYVLDFGKVIAAGPPDVVRTDPQVVSAYLGLVKDHA